ncbi:hypothetical protein F5Y05DRAFT_233547 [Hypoxylon sp. FL0543]|nr:hypothetical protein F5Y05DRAFT_233547 [Hypoxylon sp. FL0543]
MSFKTAAVVGFAAISGVLAGADNYPAVEPSYPTYTSSYVVPYQSSAPYSVSKPATYAVNNTAPTSVWQYYNTTIPTTVVVPQYTTVCPSPTTFTYSGVHYTATTSSQTITVTNCPCTVSTTVKTMTSSLVAPGVTPTAVAPAVPGTTTTGGNSPATNPAPAPAGTSAASPAGGNSVPAGAAPAVPNTPAASVSATYSSSPTGVEISGASTAKTGFAAALLAVAMGALAL